MKGFCSKLWPATARRPTLYRDDLWELLGFGNHLSSWPRFAQVPFPAQWSGDTRGRRTGPQCPRWQRASRHMRWTAACSPRYRLIPATTGVSRELAGVHPQPVRKRDFSVAYPVLTQQFTSVTHGSDLAVTLNRQIPGIGGASGQARQPSNWRSTETSAAGGAAVQSRCRIGRGPGPSRCRRRALKGMLK